MMHMEYKAVVLTERDAGGKSVFNLLSLVH